MFSTGIFSFKDGCIHAVNRFHTKDEPYDDDVLSRFGGQSGALFELTNKGPADGGVSNVGSVVTIHIKLECNTSENIESVKTAFGLYEKYGVTEVKVEEIKEG